MNHRMTPRMARGLRMAMPVLFCMLLSFAAGAAQRFEHGLLWEIQGDGASPVYLFGTLHSEDERVTRLPMEVESALAASGRLVLEVDLNADALMSLGTGMLFGDGRTLDSVLDRNLYRRSVTAMAAQGVPEMIVERMKPWAVATTLMMPKVETGLFLDRVLYERALARGMKLEGLETAAEQLAVFEGLPLEQQVTLLVQALDQLDEFPAMLEQLVQAYLRRDLAAMQRLSDESMADTPRALAEGINARLLTERNQRMADRMRPYLEQGGSFIAVGALHLPGEEGILALLARQGYQVRVKY